MVGLRASQPASSSLLLTLSALCSCGCSLTLPCSPTAVYHKLEEGEQVEIATPGFGERVTYPANMSCEYVVQAARSSSKILVDFNDVDFEEPLFSACADYVSIRDGSSTTSKELIKLCGRTTEGSVVSHNDMLHISIASDNAVERRGARLRLSQIVEGSCGEGWTTSPSIPFCLKYHSIERSWTEAQRWCYYERSNLMTTSNVEEYDFIIDTFGRNKSIRLPWFGLYDAITEGTYHSIVFREATWPDKPQAANNSAILDCVVLDLTIDEGIAHIAEDCMQLHSFICKKYKDGSTTAVLASRQLIRRSQLKEEVDLSIWILLVIAAILFVVLLLICCKECVKERCCPSRVGQQQNALLAGGRGQTPIVPSIKNHSSSRAVELDESERKRAEQARQSSQTANEDRLVRPGNINEGSSSSNPTTVLNPPPIEYSYSSQMRQLPVNAVVHRSEDPEEVPVLPLVQPGTRTSPPPLPTPPRELELDASSLRGRTDHQRGTTIDEDSRDGTHSFFHAGATIKESTFISTREDSFLRSKKTDGLFERPKTRVLDNVSAISLDEFWNATKK